MKRIFLFSLFVVVMTIGCDDDKNTSENVNFYDNSHRVGLWASYRDTLNFIDDKNLIIQSGSKDEFDYEIENDTLILIPKDTEYRYKSTHAIKVLDSNNVILGNKQPTIGFQDGSVPYWKIRK